MPELPEVEVTRRSVADRIRGARILAARPGLPLRWPLGRAPDQLVGLTVQGVDRRGKYLLLALDDGVLLMHLGMSGSLSFRADPPPPGKHDHFDLVTSQGTLRLHDPRRFGAVLWFAGAPEHHPLLAALGPEPLSPQFNADYLYEKLRKQKRAAKLALMDNAVVVGVGNIYANECLFKAGVSPMRAANQITRQECALLVETIQAVLQRAIATGGSTLRDFVNSDGKSGYFQQEYTVYGRHNQPCLQCGDLIHKALIGQRGTFYCTRCQK